MADATEKPAEGSGRRSLATADTAALCCDRALFLAACLPVIFKRAFICCRRELGKDIRTTFPSPDSHICHSRYEGPKASGGFAPRLSAPSQSMSSPRLIRPGRRGPTRSQNVAGRRTLWCGPLQRGGMQIPVLGFKLKLILAVCVLAPSERGEGFDGSS